jgi:hypothetical protein
MSAYRKGVAARKLGKDVDANPFARNSTSWNEWFRGWWDQFQWEAAGS